MTLIIPKKCEMCGLEKNIEWLIRVPDPADIFDNPQKEGFLVCNDCYEKYAEEYGYRLEVGECERIGTTSDAKEQAIDPRNIDIVKYVLEKYSGDLRGAEKELEQLKLEESEKAYRGAIYYNNNSLKILNAIRFKGLSEESKRKAVDRARGALLLWLLTQPIVEEVLADNGGDIDLEKALRDFLFPGDELAWV